MSGPQGGAGGAAATGAISEEAAEAPPPEAFGEVLDLFIRLLVT